MEIVKQVRIVTSQKKCIFSDRSQFHFNLTGFSLPMNDGKQLYLKVDNFSMPKKRKVIKFMMYFGHDVNFLKGDQVKEFTLKYYSMEDLCDQLNCLTWNNFVANTISCNIGIATNKDSEGITTIGITTIADSNNAAADVDANAATTNPVDSAITTPPDDSALVISDDAMLDIRSQISGKPSSAVACEKRFLLKYENSRFVLNVYKDYVLVITSNIAEVLGFELEKISNSDLIKICSRYVIGDPCYFLADKERICHLLIKNLVDPAFCLGGRNYGIICSFDVEKMNMTSVLKRLACKYFHDLQFSLLNDDMESYFENDELTYHALRFTLNFLKSV